MKKALFFSIILPTHNRASMVSKAIESVITQSLSNWELIIVDDGSTDNTKEIIESFIKSDKRIKYFYQENSERSVARNNGISKAKGDWICFLDSDDLYHNNHLETFFNFISEHKFKKGLFFSGVSYGEYDEKKQFYNLNGVNNLEFVLLNTIGVPRACCHKDILLENQFEKNINIGEDKELWCRIVSKYPMFYHSQKTFIEIEHPNRSINQKINLEELETLKVIFKKNRLRKQIQKKLLSDVYFNISKNALKKNKKNLGFKFIIKSIIINVSNDQIKHRMYILINLCLGKVPKQYKVK